MALTIKATREQEDQIIYNYTVLKMSQTEAGKAVGLSRMPVQRVLKERGIEIRGVRESKIVNRSLDKDYFKKIDSLEKAYVLGFLSADGCNNGRGVTITLNSIDEIILDKIKMSLKAENEYYRFRRELENGEMADYTNLTVGCVEMSEDLTRLGCIRNKNVKLSFAIFNKIPKNLRNHFLRGYFDGDGSMCVSLAKCKKWYVQKGEFSFAGTVEFCEGLQKYLKEIGISTNLARRKHSKNSAAISATGRIRNKLFYDYIYEDCGEWFLPRKKSKFEEYFGLMRVDYFTEGIDLRKVSKKMTAPKHIKENI